MYRKNRGGQVDGRTVAPCLLTLYNLPHLEYTGIFNTITAGPKGFAKSLWCLILAAVE